MGKEERRSKRRGKNGERRGMLSRKMSGITVPADTLDLLILCLGSTPLPRLLPQRGVFCLHHDLLCYHWLADLRGRACRHSRKLERPSMC